MFSRLFLTVNFPGKSAKSKKLRIRKKLGFKCDSKIILIIGGGEGMPKGKKILKKIIARNMDAEIAIVCGNNSRLYYKAMKLKNKYGIRQSQSLWFYRLCSFTDKHL